MKRALAPLVFLLGPVAGLQAQVGTSQVQKIEADAPTAFGQFGVAIAQDAQLAAIGSPNGEGSVEFWSFDGATWSFDQRVTPTGATPSDRLGFSLDLEGDLLLAGAPDNSTWGISSGAAYVFRRVGGVWTQEQQFLTFDMQPGFKFGIDVDLDGDQLVIGGLAQTIGNLPGVYVYQHDGSSWVLEEKITVPGATPALRFGRQVHLDGDLCYVADFERVHLFERGMGGWSKTGEIVPSGGSGFAGELAIADDRMLLSRPGGDMSPGSVTPFTRIAGVWTEGVSFDSGDPQPGDEFGSSIDFAGEWLLVGARGRDWAHPANPLSNSGSAFLLRDVAGTWQHVAELVPEDPLNNDNFGRGVRVLDGRLMIGSRSPADGGDQRGAVYFFDIATDLVGTSLCFGDGGVAPGCTPCPCGNDAPLGTEAGCLHGAGSAAQLVATGAPSVSSDSLRMDLRWATTGTFTLLVAGSDLLPSSGACPPGSGVSGTLLDGLRCVGGGTLRLGTRKTNAVGATVRPWPSTPSLIAQGGFVAGQTWHFQATFRDFPALGCGTGLNTSQAISILVTP